MAVRSATTAALLVAGSVVLSLSGCGTKQTQGFLSIQTSRIETTTFSPVFEAIGDHGDGWRGFMEGASPVAHKQLWSSRPILLRLRRNAA